MAGKQSKLTWLIQIIQKSEGLVMPGYG